MNEPLIQLYTNLLQVAGLSIDEDRVVLNIGNKKLPFMIDSKQLVLPTPEFLSGNYEDIIVFHPAQERGNEGCSPTLVRLRDAINWKAGTMFYEICQSLVDISLDSSKNIKQNNELRDMLIGLPGVDKKFQTTLAGIFKAIKQGNLISYAVNISQQRDVKINGKTYSRGAIVNFPFYRELQSGIIKEIDVKSLKLRDKDFEILISLYRLVFPGIDEVRYYSKGAESVPVLAPWLESLVRVTSELYGVLYEKLYSLRNHTTAYKDHYVSLDPLEAFYDTANLKAIINLVPPQTGNHTNVNRQQNNPDSETSYDGLVQGNVKLPPTQPQYPQPQYPQQQYQHTPPPQQQKPQAPPQKPKTPNYPTPSTTYSKTTPITPQQHNNNQQQHIYQPQQNYPTPSVNQGGVNNFQAPMTGYYPNTAPPNQFPPNGYYPNPMVPNPMMGNPLVPNGYYPNPMVPNPLMQNPMVPNQFPPNGYYPNPMVPNPMMGNPLMQNPMVPNPLGNNGYPVVNQRPGTSLFQTGNNGWY